MNRIQDFSKIRLDGGNLSLNFVNTIHDRYEEPRQDYLNNYTDLVGWAHYAGGINTVQRNNLLRYSQNQPDETEKIFGEAIQLRETIYSYTLCLINEEKVSSEDAEFINQWLSKAFSNLELTQLKNAYLLDWKEEHFGLESVLWPIIKSFAELMTSDSRNRIKLCSSCGWMFVDGSKNNSRRWCSMETCGNRVKARRFAKKNQS